MTGIEDRRPGGHAEAIVADDHLIDAIARTPLDGAPPADDGAGGQLSSLLMAWRRHALDRPGTTGDDPDNVVELAPWRQWRLAEGPLGRRRRRSARRPRPPAPSG
jgi:hypothetical protein